MLAVSTKSKRGLLSGYRSKRPVPGVLLLDLLEYCIPEGIPICDRRFRRVFIHRDLPNLWLTDPIDIDDTQSGDYSDYPSLVRLSDGKPVPVRFVDTRLFDEPVRSLPIEPNFEHPHLDIPSPAHIFQIRSGSSNEWRVRWFGWSGHKYDYRNSSYFSWVLPKRLWPLQDPSNLLQLLSSLDSLSKELGKSSLTSRASDITFHAPIDTKQIVLAQLDGNPRIGVVLTDMAVFMDPSNIKHSYEDTFLQKILDADYLISTRPLPVLIDIPPDAKEWPYPKRVRMYLSQREGYKVLYPMMSGRAYEVDFSGLLRYFSRSIEDFLSTTVGAKERYLQVQPAYSDSYGNQCLSLESPSAGIALIEDTMWIACFGSRISPFLQMCGID